MSLKSRLEKYMREHHTEWIPKGVLCDLARHSDLKATGEHTGRRLRQLKEAGVLEVKIIKKHAHYRYKTQESPAEINRQALAFFENYQKV